MPRAWCRTSVVAVAFATMAVPSMCRAEEAKVDSKHTCIVVRALDRADSEFAAALSAHASAVAGCLISEVSGREPGAIRAEAASALVQAIATANPRLDSHTSVRAHEAVVKALRDRSVEVRVATVTALADFGDESMVPLLQSVAKTDPILSLRDYTALAIARMCKRLAVQ
jgi:hypothetical protein